MSLLSAVILLAMIALIAVCTIFACYLLITLIVDVALAITSRENPTSLRDRRHR